MNPNNFFTEKELAKRWGMSYRTLQHWRRYRKGPAYLKLHGRVRYAQSDVEHFEANQRFSDQRSLCQPPRKATERGHHHE